MEVKENMVEEANDNKALVLIMVTLITLIAVIAITLAGLLLGWITITKGEIVLSKNNITLDEGDTKSIKLENAKELEGLELRFSGYEEDLLQVSRGRNNTIVIHANGKCSAQVTVSAKGYQDQIIDVTVNGVRPVTELDIDGKAYASSSVQYFFLNDSKYVVVSPDYEYYSRGNYKVETMTSHEVRGIYSVHYDSVLKKMEELVSGGTYYRVVLDGHEEYLGGSKYSDVGASLIMCTNGNNLAVYDISWDELVLVDKIDMLTPDQMDSYFDF